MEKDKLGLDVGQDKCHLIQLFSLKKGEKSFSPPGLLFCLYYRLVYLRVYHISPSIYCWTASTSNPS